MKKKLAAWRRVVDVDGLIRANARVKPSPYLYVREGSRTLRFRVDLRQKDLRLRQMIPGDFTSIEDWPEANRLAEALISEERVKRNKPEDQKLIESRAIAKEQERAFIRTETLCDELVALRSAESPATYSQTELFFRVHIKPVLSGQCPYEKDRHGRYLGPCGYETIRKAAQCEFAVDLNPTHYDAYKAHYRLHRPKGSLFNHWKFWIMLFKYATNRGLIKKFSAIGYDEEKEDFRKPGNVMPDEHLIKVLAIARTRYRSWYGRILFQRFCGQRPGLTRQLRKSQVDLLSGVCRVAKADSKNRREYSFVVPGFLLEVLREMADRYPDSPYFFPMETDHHRPADKHLGGWHALLDQSGVRPISPAVKDDQYTPHDLRHSYLTFKFKVSKNPALICFQTDLSLEEAMATYIHFDAEDTRPIADETSAEALKILGVTQTLDDPPAPQDAISKENTGSEIK